MARAWRSASNLAMTSRVSIPGLMIFSATRRENGLSLLGHEDHSEASFSDDLEKLVAADSVAGLLSDLAPSEVGSELVKVVAHCACLQQHVVDEASLLGI